MWIGTNSTIRADAVTLNELSKPLVVELEAIISAERFWLTVGELSKSLVIALEDSFVAIGEELVTTSSDKIPSLPKVEIANSTKQVLPLIYEYWILYPLGN